MTQHSIIPPSSAAIWGKPNGCTGWVAMSKAFPDGEKSSAAIEGMIAHELAALKIINYFDPDDSETVAALQATDYRADIDGDMRDGVALFVDNVKAELEKRPNPNNVMTGVEEEIAIPSIHPLAFGTVDCYLYDSDTSELIIWDFKYGRNIVEAFENWQGICYAAGLLPMIFHTEQSLPTIRVRIVQPRAFHREGHIRDWAISSEQLQPYIDTLKLNAHKALSEQAECMSGNHCKYCSARHGCQAAIDGGIVLYESVAKPLPSNTEPNELARRYWLVKRAREQLGYLETGYETELMAHVLGGKAIAGIGIEHGNGTEVWTKPMDEIIRLGKMLDIDLDQHKTLTPNQARKAGMSADLVAAYSKRNTGTGKLVKDNSDKKAKEKFGNDN